MHHVIKKNTVKTCEISRVTCDKKITRSKRVQISKVHHVVQKNIVKTCESLQIQGNEIVLEILA